jgi:hypothetical protein
MNLSPDMARMIAVRGHDVVHWSQIGDHRATDLAILTWAREHERVLVTHDLDFAAILAETEDVGLAARAGWWSGEPPRLKPHASRMGKGTEETEEGRSGRESGSVGLGKLRGATPARAGCGGAL